MNAPHFICAVLAAGCGRLGFGEALDGQGAGSDAADVACPGFAILCDDFETGNFNKWSFVGMNFNGTIAATSTRVHGGAKALEVTMPSQASDAERDLVLRRPVQSTGTLAIKTWANFPETLDRFNLIFVLRNPNTGQYLTLGGNNGLPVKWVSTDNSLADVLTDHDGSGDVPALDMWVCVELVVDFASRRVRAYVDEAPVLDAIMNDTAPAYTDIAVGVPRADSAGFHVFIDDVVIANQRIGCP